MQDGQLLNRRVGGIERFLPAELYLHAADAIMLALNNWVVLLIATARL
jgi:hypothetical protein